MAHPHDETHFVRCLKCLKILKCSRYDTTTLLEHIRTDHPEIEIVDSVSLSRNSAGSPLVGAQTAGDGRNGGDGGDGNDVAPSMGNDRLRGSTATNNANGNNKPRLSTQSERANVGPLPDLKSFKDIEDMPSSECCGGEEQADPKTIYSRQNKTTKPAPKIQTARKCSLYRTSIERWRPANGTIYCPKCGTNKRPLIKTRSERMSQNSCGAACLLGCWPFCFLPFLCPGDEKEYLHCAQCKTFLGLYDRNNNCIKPNREFLDSAGAAVGMGVEVGGAGTMPNENAFDEQCEEM